MAKGTNNRGTVVISRVTKWQTNLSDAGTWFRHLRSKGTPCCIVQLGSKYAVYRELRVTDLLNKDAKPSDLWHYASRNFHRTISLADFSYRWGL